ncbi:MAG TPA: hypothetical protein DEO84_03030 [candidate division Zixibacteria bacterium]|nr:hypothetical protein [candidate division Zixibacteria bacterium]HBZ00274.1 hypothetical protein [candidate division Zixibacteria bacterium]
MIYSALIPLLIFLPNVVLIFAPPIKDSLPEKINKTASYILFETIEWISRLFILVIPFFSKIYLGGGIENWCLAIMFIAMGLYYLVWARYMFGGRDYRLLYSNLWKIPLPLALSPFIYFLGASFILHSMPMLLTAITFGATHIHISRLERDRLLCASQNCTSLTSS